MADALQAVSSDSEPIERPSIALGRSLGRAARLATVWLGAAAGSIERAFTRPSSYARLANARPLQSIVDELAALVRAQPADDGSVLLADTRFWSLIEELYAAREPDAERRARATGAVEASVGSAAAPAEPVAPAAAPEPAAPAAASAADAAPATSAKAKRAAEPKDPAEGDPSKPPA